MIQAAVGTLPNPGLMEHGVFGGYRVDGMMASHLFELHNLQLKMESGLLFSFLLFLFFKKITPLSFARIS